MDMEQLRRELNLRDDEETIDCPTAELTESLTYRKTYLVVLTDSALMIRKGPVCLNCVPRVEQNIFLDRIQDVTLVQTCMQRCFDLYQINVETAGKSSEGPEVVLTGIVNPREFREHILRQRELYTALGKGGDGLGAARSAPRAPTQAAQPAVAQVPGTGPSNAEISESVQQTNALLADIKDALAQNGTDLNQTNQKPPADLGIV